MRKENLAYTGLIFMTLITGLSFMFMKIGLKYSTPYDLLAHRFSTAFVSILILVVFKIIKIPKVELKDWLVLLGVSIFYPILFFLFQTLGMKYSTASEAGIIFAFLPIFTLVAGGIFLKEKTHFLQKIGSVVSISGLIFIFKHKNISENINISSIIFLLLSVSSMVSYLMLGKKIMRKYNSLSLTAVMIIIGFILFNIISISQHINNNTINLFFEPFFHFYFICSILYLGILSSVLTSFLSNYALTCISASQISIFSNLNPVIAIVSGVVFLGEGFFWFDMIGTMLVLLGVALVLIFKIKT